MSAFEYSALDKSGRTRKGVLEGDTPRQIRQQLREQGLSPLAVEETKTVRRQRTLTRAGAIDVALITRQLATLTGSGVAVEESLRTISRQTEKARLKGLLLAVRSRVLEGHSLAEGLADFPDVFPEMYRATVAAGEQSGHLEAVLNTLADYTETRQHLRRKTLLALFYPLLLTGAAILVTAGLLAYVVPQVVQVFDNIQQELPWLTRVLIALSDFLRDHGGWLLAALVLMGLGLRYLLRFPGPLNAFHRLLLLIPVISRLERGMNAARFTRTLSILGASGVPMLDALRISAQVITSRPMRAAVQEAAEKIREGASLHIALEQSGLFPPITVSLIASGEASGNLEHMLERAAVNQEHEADALTGILLGLFEPLLILVMGGVVLTIVLAILMPIFELNQLVK
ncbi:MAG: type II secretion system inner membrane protein GspF [Gammaproteobacteria bacterium]|nr:type II secretion system inner membrane protein GspF [Gammaproteobacteria bacterium]